MAEDKLRAGTPLLGILLDPEDLPRSARLLLDSIDEDVLKPLRTAADDVEWRRRCVDVLPSWAALRVAFVVALAKAGVDPAPDVDLDAHDLHPALDDTARKAATYAIRLLLWVGRQSWAAVAQRARLNEGALHVAADDLMQIELAWISLGRPEIEPRVAIAAAWHAYSHARSMRGILSQVGFPLAEMPTETPQEALARARAMLRRVHSHVNETVRSSWRDELLPRDEDLT